MELGCSSRYNKLETKRERYLDRAREVSELTIPALLPPEGFTSSTDLYTPYQSVGARGVNNLASKLLLLLLPPNVPFFRLMPDNETVQELNNNPQVKAEVESALSGIEREVMDEIEAQAIRVSVFEALKHLLISGNVLIHLPPQGALKIFPLTNYVCRRDPDGQVLEIIVKELVSREAMGGYTLNSPEGAVDIHLENSYTNSDAIPLYTKIIKVEDRYQVYQELDDVILPDSYGEYPADMLSLIHI